MSKGDKQFSVSYPQKKKEKEKAFTLLGTSTGLDGEGHRTWLEQGHSEAGLGRGM